MLQQNILQHTDIGNFAPDGK